jgi:Asp-tRNA(Asn)/Glu-tRNA(Gln) amidotransferase A subunit family amidase
VRPVIGWSEALDRIEATDLVIRAFLAEDGRRERVAAEARAAAPDGTLYGVPVGVKDIVRVDGLPTRAGSAVPPEVLAGPQATLVDRLRAAGAVVAGKTVTAEFAMTAPGPTRNPHNPEHTPGGSSMGSAAAVAAGMVPLAIGTQTIGSVIRPAAYCGVVGFKPTHGRVPVDGIVPNVPSFDTVGVLAADLAGAALAAGVLCDGWREPAGHRRPVLGVPAGPYLDRAGTQAREAFAARVKAFRESGLTIRKVRVMADFERIVLLSYVVNRYEAARTHAEWFPRHGHLHRERTAATIRQGQAITPADYYRALRGRADFRDRLLGTMADEGVDAWITPAATGPAPHGLDGTGDGIMCPPWSTTGLPALCVPAGRAAGGLPLGLQIVGRPGADEELLSWAAGLLPAS